VPRSPSLAVVLAAVTVAVLTAEAQASIAAARMGGTPEMRTTSAAQGPVDADRGSSVVDFSLSKRASGRIAVSAVRSGKQITVTFAQTVVRVPSFTGGKARFTYRVAAICGGRYGDRGTAASPSFSSAPPKGARAVSLPRRQVGVTVPTCPSGRSVGVVFSVSADLIGGSPRSLFVAANAIPQLRA